MMKIDKHRFRHCNEFGESTERLSEAYRRIRHFRVVPHTDIWLAPQIRISWDRHIYSDYWIAEAEEVVRAWAQRTEGVVTDIDGSRWDFIHDEVFASAWERSE